MSIRRFVPIAVLATAALLIPLGSGAQEAQCGGLAATIVGDVDGDGVITGTDGDDVIVGTKDSDVIIGGEGNDTICALGGDDDVTGDGGDDLVFAQAGNDVVSGDDGNDRLLGGWGDDRLLGKPGDDELIGYLGDDDLRGGGGNDLVLGGPGHDYLRGHRGDDTLGGGAGHDQIRAGLGEDTLDGGEGSDACGGSGARSSCEIKGVGRRDAEKWRSLIAPYFDPPGETDNAVLIIDCESLGDPFEVNPKSNASGLFQFIESTWNWVADNTGSPTFYEGRFDPEWQAINAIWLVQQSIDTDHPNGPWGHWSCRWVTEGE